MGKFYKTPDMEDYSFIPTQFFVVSNFDTSDCKSMISCIIVLTGSSSSLDSNNSSIDSQVATDGDNGSGVLATGEGASQLLIDLPRITEEE